MNQDLKKENAYVTLTKLITSIIDMHHIIILHYIQKEISKSLSTIAWIVQFIKKYFKIENYFNPYIPYNCMAILYIYKTLSSYPKLNDP